MSRIITWSMVAAVAALMFSTFAYASTETCRQRCYCQKGCWTVRDRRVDQNDRKANYNKCGRKLWSCLAVCSAGDNLNVKSSLPRL